MRKEFLTMMTFYLEDFNKNVLFAAVDSEGEYFFEE